MAALDTLASLSRQTGSTVAPRFVCCMRPCAMRGDKGAMPTIEGVYLLCRTKRFMVGA